MLDAAKIRFSSGSVWDGQQGGDVLCRQNPRRLIHVGFMSYSQSYRICEPTATPGVAKSPGSQQKVLGLAENQHSCLPWPLQGPAVFTRPLI